jgi:hypothetical protein
MYSLGAKLTMLSLSRYCSCWSLLLTYTQHIEEAKLSVFGDIDVPVPPSEKGHSQFLFNRTHAMKQE